MVVTGPNSEMRAETSATNQSHHVIECHGALKASNDAVQFDGKATQPVSQVLLVFI